MFKTEDSIMNDIWATAESDYLNKKHKVKLTNGLYMFRMVKRYPTKDMVNDFAKASNEYKNQYVHKDNEEIIAKPDKYKVYPLDVRAIYWNDKPLIGRLVHIELVENVMLSMAELRLKLREYHYELTDTILYWKPNRVTVKFAFLTDSMYDKLKPLIHTQNTQELSEYVYWYGRKEKWDEDRFKSFYGGVMNNE